MQTNIYFRLAKVLALGLTVSLLAAAALAGEVNLSSGQVVYAPAYSHIYFGDREREFNLAVTLSVRNVSPDSAITVTEVQYRDESGKLIKYFAKEPLPLAALESKTFVVRESDTSGGAGASFLVTWRSQKPTPAPLIETVMIGTQMQQGVSFTSRGIVVKELGGP
jgi:hypothetical protein